MRNADLTIDEEEAEDLLKEIREAVEKDASGARSSAWKWRTMWISAF